MAVNTVYKQGWTMEDIHWSLFDPSKVEPRLLAAVKAAALVEYNAPDYVIYLKRVFAGNPATQATIEQWGREEAQHGRALGRWAEMADPDFKLEEAFARFRKGYTPAHFAEDEEGSVRGSRRGEMIARCVVESGTSSYYSAIRDASEEPLLKEIAGRIAADEYRHYKLFYDTLNEQPEPDLGFWKKLWIAVSRVRESDDDELAYSYYCANVPPEKEIINPYVRKKYSKAAGQASMSIYHRHHIQKLVQMVVKVLGANPHGWLAAIAGALLWRRMAAKSA
jgi:rubrerythrin